MIHVTDTAIGLRCALEIKEMRIKTTVCFSAVRVTESYIVEILSLIHI